MERPSDQVPIMANSDHRAAARWFSTIAIVLGLLVPILPRLVVPVFSAGRYVDTLYRVFFMNPVSGAKLLLWTALPFLILALVGYRLLRGAHADRFRFRRASLLTITVIMFLTGIVIHVPSRPGTGFNFGVAFFPFYAAAVGGLTAGALLLGRGVWRHRAR